MINIRERFFEMQDCEYGAFQSKLVPNISSEKIIGIRTPSLRAFAREVYLDGEYENFLHELPHTYYEENNLHAFIIEKIKDYDACMAELERFLPYVDNWATCDCMSPKVLAKNTDRLYEQIKSWIASEHTYTVRYGIKTLLTLYSKDEFRAEHMYLLADINSDEYYIKMAVAWYFATVLAFHFDEAFEFLKEHRLDAWTRNKAIQKAKESFRVTKEHKNMLNNIKF